jgi:hypothetical protein
MSQKTTKCIGGLRYFLSQATDVILGVTAQTLSDQRKRNHMQKKSVTYQQLQSTMAKEGCPICNLGARAGNQYLDSLLWESVNDPEIRDELTDALGLCGRHTRELFTFPGERLGTAIIQRAVLKEAMERLQGKKPQARRNLLQNISHQWLKTRITATDPAVPSVNPCPACGQQSTAENRAMITLLEHLIDDLDAPLRQVGGLCWPHMQMALAYPQEAETHARLLQLHQEVWGELLADLDELIRKYDYRFKAESATERERHAVERSVTVMTGEYGLR